MSWETDVLGIRNNDRGVFGISGGGARFVPGGTVRDCLVATLAVGRSDEEARAIVDALDAYLEEGPERAPLNLENLAPNLRGEVERLRVERDRAIRLAEETVRQVQSVLNSLRDPELKKAAE